MEMILFRHVDDRSLVELHNKARPYKLDVLYCAVFFVCDLL